MVMAIVIVTGFDPTSITLGDFNGDNQADIAVTNSNSKNIGIFLGFGNGNFRSQIVLSNDDRSIYL
jgi:hypothetical protein